MALTCGFNRRLIELKLFSSQLLRTCPQTQQRNGFNTVTTIASRRRRRLLVLSSTENHILPVCPLVKRSLFTLMSLNNSIFGCETNRNSVLVAQKREMQNDNHSFSGFSNSGGGSYDVICEETLDSLAECFEQLASEHFHEPDVDISLNAGVLTVNLGSENGTYVINKQTPNQQIWLSSPFSGPKRYDFMAGRWIYRRDGTSLHVLLGQELTEIIGKSVDFSRCSYGK